MQTIFTPWRFRYISMNDQDEGCFFCQAAASRDQVDSLVVWRGEHHLVMLNRYPYTNGHLMVAPLEHIADPGLSGPDAQLEFWPLVLESQGVLSSVYSPDGFNINLKCGSQHTEDLRARVVEVGAAAGLAFDGDGDRLIAVDETGQELTGDQILLILANASRNAGTLKSDLLVTTVMSNIGLTVACKEQGFGYHASKVGDRYVLEDMKELGSVMGGEESGHIILLDNHTTGDGIIAAMRLVAAMVQEGKPLSELAGLMRVFPQKLINVEVASKPAVESLPELVKVIKEVEGELGEEGRVLVRFSGTQNVCRVMVEGPSDEVTQKYCEIVVAAVKQSMG